MGGVQHRPGVSGREASPERSGLAVTDPVGSPDQIVNADCLGRTGMIGQPDRVRAPELRHLGDEMKPVLGHVSLFSTNIALSGEPNWSAAHSSTSARARAFT